MSAGLITDKKLCKKLSEDYKNSPILLWQNKDDGPAITHVIQGSDSKEILANVLGILPNPEILDDHQFRVS